MSANVEEMLLSNDPETRAKGLELYEKMENGDYDESMETEEVSEVVDNTSTEEPLNTTENDTPSDASKSVSSPMENHTETSVEMTQEEKDEIKRQLEIVYRGKKVVKDDPDGYLGRKDLDGLKKAKLNADAHIEFLESEIEKMRNTIQSEPKVTPTPTTPTPTTPAPEVPKIQRPRMPEIANPDPSYWTPEESQAMHDYWKKMGDYEEAVKDPRVDELTQKMKEYESVIKEFSKTKEDLVRKEEEMKYWTSLDSFREAHPEYSKIKKPIKDLNQEVDKWGTRLANAAGIDLPLNPTKEDIQKFEYTKTQLMNKYRNGDEVLMKTGLTPPNGYEEVFNLSKLEIERGKLVRDGILGKNASLHEAWLYLQDKDGFLDNGIATLEAEARRRGAESVLNVTSQKQSENAVTIPDSAVRSAQIDLSNISPEEYERILSASPMELQANPELRKKKAALLLSI